jgi:hypothetical protein
LQHPHARPKVRLKTHRIPQTSLAGRGRESLIADTRNISRMLSSHASPQLVGRRFVCIERLIPLRTITLERDVEPIELRSGVSTHAGERTVPRRRLVAIERRAPVPVCEGEEAIRARSHKKRKRSGMMQHRAAVDIAAARWVLLDQNHDDSVRFLRASDSAGQLGRWFDVVRDLTSKFRD